MSENGLISFDFTQLIPVLADSNNMADDFTCRVVSVQDQGAAHIEKLSCNLSLDSDSTRVVEVARVTFSPEKLNVVDINARRRFLVGKHHGDKNKIVAELKDFFRSPVGGKATEVLAMSDFSDVAVVTGGIYFADSTHDIIWPQTGETTKQGDGFVWYRPDPNRQGHVLSEQQGNFVSGGYLLLNPKGQALLIRLRNVERLSDTQLQTAAGEAYNFDDYRFIIQSNMVLVDNGIEDENQNTQRNAVAALSVQQDGKLSLVAAAEPGKPSNGFGLTHKEFGELLVELGSRYAINLDGGPSAQFAIRKENCQNVQSPELCIEDLIHHTDPTNPMPQVFLVSK